jgi:hypothetical protein
MAGVYLYIYIYIYKGTARKGKWSEKAGCVRLVEQVIQNSRTRVKHAGGTAVAALVRGGSCVVAPARLLKNDFGLSHPHN